jgi:uncharacterized protein
MTISLYDASVPVLKQMMGTLSIILDKAEQRAKSENIAQEVLLSARLFPDMYDLTRQIQMSSILRKPFRRVWSRYGGSLLPGQRDDI